MKYQHLRHATGVLSYGEIDILIDPIFAPKEANPPITNSWNELRNPMVDFPFDLSSFKLPEHCLVTHLHSDHFDDYAKELLPKETRLLCQCENEDHFKNIGFTNVTSIDKELTLETINIQRVPGQHGTGITAKLMGISSGYILSAPNEPILYITGDTIFYKDVKATLEKYKPDVILAFGGAAQFSHGDPITLATEDILKLHEFAPQAKIICVHMNTINHCRTTKEALKAFLSSKLGDSQYHDSFFIPDDGETIDLSQLSL